MGIVICEKHGRSQIVHLSTKLCKACTENTCVSIVKVKVKVIPLNLDLVHFQMKDEDIFQFNEIKSIDELESIDDSATGDATMCTVCFNEYVACNNIAIREYEFIVDGVLE